MPRAENKTDTVSFNRETRLRLWRIIRSFWSSESGLAGRLLLGAMLVMLVGINVLNVVNSYVGRDFMTAIESQVMADFLRNALLYVAVFAASTAVAVIQRFAEERLGLRWRAWLTRQAVQQYLAHRTYYWVKESGEVQNPDQRMAEDIRFLIATTLSFLLIVLNTTFTIVAFSGVLWTISPLLFAVAVGYALLGSALAIWLGKPLVWLSYRQLDFEASFRAEIVHVRENAESVATLHREGRLQARILRRLEELTANLRRITSVSRNLGFFTTGYNYLIQIIPALIVAPMFIRGDVEFGVITQSAIAFTHLVAAFSIIITQFQSISTYAAVVARLGSLFDAFESAPQARSFVTQLRKESGCLAYENLTLRAPGDDRPLVSKLNVSVQPRSRVLLKAANPMSSAALFRATLGLWDGEGEGCIARPDLDDILFLTERPYLSPGTLREALLRTGMERQVSDERIFSVLEELEVRDAVERVGGLDVEKDWDNLLSLPEQQSLVAARLILTAPPFVLVSHLDTTVGPEQEARVLAALHRAGVTYLVLDGQTENLSPYDALLEFAEDGSWTWRLLGPPSGS